MKNFKIAIASLVLIVGCWIGFKDYRCRRRNDVFGKQIEDFRRDAREKLKAGTKQAELSRFFEEHHANLRIVESEAFGTVLTRGCAPLGCSTDAAIISIRVKLDKSGSVQEASVISGMYTNCL